MSLIEVRFLLFAWLKEYIGSSTYTVRLTKPCSVSSALEEVDKVLIAKSAPVGHRVSSCLVSSGDTFVDLDSILSHSCELAIIPPVSGG